MPLHPTPFIKPPNFRSDDWWGQIGKQIDPSTNAPVAGWIFDCNTSGHTMRPYKPPRRSFRYALVYWIDTLEPARFPSKSAIIILDYLIPPDDWSQTVEKDGFIFSAEVNGRENPLNGLIRATFTTPDMLNFAVQNSYCNVLQAWMMMCWGAKCFFSSDYRGPILSTPAQLAQQTAFGEAQAAWAELDEKNKDSYNQAAQRLQMTGNNLFIHDWFA